MKKVSVIGSLNMDVILEVEHFPLEGQSIFARNSSLACGGKGGNAAVALGKLGVETVFTGCIGEDDYGRKIQQNLESAGVVTKLQVLSDVSTGVAYVILESNSNNRIIVVPGANEAMSVDMIREIAPEVIGEANVVLIQLEINRDCIREIVAQCRKRSVTLVVDAGPIRGVTMEDLRGATCVSPNETELEALAGRELKTREDVVNAARSLLDYDVEFVVVKRGSDGAIFVDKTRVMEQPAFPVVAVDTTAAGDSFMAGLCAAILRGESMEEALIFANKCGAIAVTRKGASPSTPSAEDIENFEMFLRGETE